MFWSTKNKTTTYNYPNANVGSNTTVISVGGGSGGGTGSYAISASSIINTATGGSGLSGQYLGTNGWTSITSSAITQASGTIIMTGNLNLDCENPHINTKKNKIDIDKLYQNLQIVNEMFHIIVPDFNKLEKNPTLMDAFIQYDSAKHIEPRYNSEQYIAAYEQYMVLEALTKEKHDNS